MSKYKDYNGADMPDEMRVAFEMGDIDELVALCDENREAILDGMRSMRHEMAALEKQEYIDINKPVAWNIAEKDRRLQDAKKKLKKAEKQLKEAYAPVVAFVKREIGLEWDDVVDLIYNMAYEDHRSDGWRSVYDGAMNLLEFLNKAMEGMKKAETNAG